MNNFDITTEGKDSGAIFRWYIEKIEVGIWLPNKYRNCMANVSKIGELPPPLLQDPCMGTHIQIKKGFTHQDGGGGGFEANHSPSKTESPTTEGIFTTCLL